MKLACKDINPNTTCDFEVSGDSAEEVAEKMIEHAKTNHSEDVKNMTDEEMVKEFKSKAHE